MITLYTFGPFFGLPYQTNTKGFPKAPKGKLPYIEDGGTLIADSTHIRLHLEQKHGIDLDKGLSPRDRGIAWATDKMLEDHFYWHLIYWRWMNHSNFERGPKGFFNRAPALILGDNRYFMGPTPCGVDATVFAFVAGTLCKTFDSPLRAKLEGMNNLVAYSERMMAEYFPASVAKAA